MNTKQCDVAIYLLNINHLYSISCSFSVHLVHSQPYFSYLLTAKDNYDAHTEHIQCTTSCQGNAGTHSGGAATGGTQEVSL